MATKRTRVFRNIIADISAEELFFLSDGLLGSPPAQFDYQTFRLEGDREARRKLWDAHRSEILAAWIRECPGTRPALWYEFDAPRMSRVDLAWHGWEYDYFAAHLCDPRKRVAGIGDPAAEHLAYVPYLPYGIPDRWITEEDLKIWPGLKATAFNPDDPPKYESEAAYLDRHGLLLPEEKRQLKREDFEPEIIQPPQEESEESYE